LVVFHGELECPFGLSFEIFGTDRGALEVNLTLGSRKVVLVLSSVVVVQEEAAKNEPPLLPISSISTFFFPTNPL